MPVKDTVMKTAKGDLRTVIFNDTEREETHVAFVCGEVDANTPIPVRIHVESDVMGVLKGLNNQSQSTFPVQDAIDYILQAGSGIVVVLRYGQTVDEVIYDIEQMQDKQQPASQGHLRLLGSGSQILSSLGAGKIRVLGRERKTHGLSGFGIEIVDYIQR